MSQIEIDRVLAQMDTLAAQARGRTSETDGKADFSALLRGSIDQVNGVQHNAGKLAKSFETGDPETSLADVMISIQKARVSFQAMVQVRNKLVEAYKDVMNLNM